VAAAAVALAALGAARPPRGTTFERGRGWSCDGSGCTPPTGGGTVPLSAHAGATLWLVAAPGATGTVELAGARVELVAEQRSYPVTVATGRIKLRTIDGAPRLVAVVVGK
jgi:hypothetical protein